MTTAPAVEVEHLVKRYDGRAVVDDLSLRVEQGEVYAVLGPNGAGKTTTVEILEGYRRPDAGRVRVLGLDPSRDGRALRQRIGLMLQQGGTYPQITVREAIHLFASFYARAEDPDLLLERLDLHVVAGTRFRHLSGGQKQRLNLATALVGKPELVFLDEPTAAMDPQGRRVTWNIVRELQERGTTVILTTHIMEEAEQLADRVAILRQGRLVAEGAPAALRRTVGRQLRLTTDPIVDGAALAALFGVPPDGVHADRDGSMVIDVEPSPELVARLAEWLRDRHVLLTELRAGSRSLEEAFLAMMGEDEQR